MRPPQFPSAIRWCAAVFRIACALTLLECVRAAIPADRNPRRTAATPNLVLIVADDLGYGDLGCYGQRDVLTPNLDRLAAEGLRFTQAYAGNTVCAPSRCTLLTGRHSGHGRVRSNVQVPLEPDDFTLGDLAKRSGYRTAVFGKWALGWEGSTGTPNRRGFDEWFGFLDQSHAHEYYPTYLWRNEEPRPLSGNQGGARRDYAPDWFDRAATNFIRIYEDKPFLLYFPSTLPHANNELGTNGMEVPSLGIYRDQPWPAPEKAKAAMISRLDASVGRIMDDLRARHIDQDTVVMFTSDNGPHSEGGVHASFLHSSGPLRGIKRDLYEGGIRVPLIVRWPGHIKPGTTVDRPVAFWDILPTVADLLQTNLPAKTDGVSFAAVLEGREPKANHDHFYWEFHERGYQRAVRSGDWKAIDLGEGKPVELYNLAEDPAEKQECAAAHPEIVARLREVMRTAADPFVQPENKSPFKRQ